MFNNKEDLKSLTCGDYKFNIDSDIAKFINKTNNLKDSMYFPIELLNDLGSQYLEEIGDIYGYGPIQNEKPIDWVEYPKSKIDNFIEVSTKYNDKMADVLKDYMNDFSIKNSAEKQEIILAFLDKEYKQLVDLIDKKYEKEPLAHDLNKSILMGFKQDILFQLGNMNNINTDCAYEFDKNFGKIGDGDYSYLINYLFKVKYIPNLMNFVEISAGLHNTNEKINKEELDVLLNKIDNQEDVISILSNKELVLNKEESNKALELYKDNDRLLQNIKLICQLSNLKALDDDKLCLKPFQTNVNNLDKLTYIDNQKSVIEFINYYNICNEYKNSQNSVKQ